MLTRCSFSPRLRARSILVGLLSSGLPLRADVVLSEVHYNPSEGAAIEFVELHNSGLADVPLDGWSFSEGIRFVFPEGALIEANGFAVVCQYREAVAEHFALPLGSLFGDYTGSLDNGGETLTLLDSSGVVVDSLRYDDDAPWDADADGGGPSLERVCAFFDSSHPGNWNAATGSDPSPLQPSRVTQCPPPAIPPPAIAINEIYYHPLQDADAKEEFIELRNTTGQAVNLKGYSFNVGVEFAFLEDTVLEPGAIVVVCRDKEHMRAAHDVQNVVGNFTGQLSNDGERITLVDPEGAYVDSVRYQDRGDWPVAADGLGYSLEKIVPGAVSDDPASWKEAAQVDPGEWGHVSLSGVATSSKVLIYLDGSGEFLIDNVVLIDPANPGVNLVPNGTFDVGLEPWIARETHADTTWDSTGGPDQSGAMRLVANGEGSGAANGLSIGTVPELAWAGGHTYQLSLDYKHVTGAKGLLVQVSGASSTQGIYSQLWAGATFSPGKPNGSESDRLPPFVGLPARSPQEPGSRDATWITAKVRGQSALSAVRLRFSVNGAAESIALDMIDDGQHGDGAPGDGVHGVAIPAQAHNTIVTFRIEALDAMGSSRASPPSSDPTGFHGFYVNDLRPDTPLPNYTLLLDHTTATLPRTIVSLLNCRTYRTASFAHRGDLYYNVGIRQRGLSVCGSTKPFLKVRFQRGRDFENQRKINLQSLWTDKSLIREVLSWQLFGEVGMPTCREEYIRLHVNGKYFGLYAALEHPDQRFLERNKLNPEGNLYKATSSNEKATGTYEKKTNENGDFSDLREFLTTMHATPRDELRAFFTERVDEDRIIDYEMGQTLTNNSDYAHHNHYLYHDTERGKWMPLAWDLDLTFGKNYGGTYGGVLHDKMDNPGNIPWDELRSNHLLDKFFSQAGDWYRRAYVLRLWDALEEKYTEGFFAEKIAFLQSLLLEEQAEDIAAWGRSATFADDRAAPSEFEPNLARVTEHIRQRRAFLIDYLKTRSAFDGHDRLKVTEVLYNPSGPDEDLEFLELWNPGSKEIDVSSWSVEGLGYAFPAGTLIGAGEVFVLSKNPDAFRAEHGPDVRAFGPYEGNLDNDGEILRVKDAGPGHAATVDFLRYGNKGDWPREGDGLGYSIELTRVAPERDNDLGVSWRRSRARGGSPGEIEGLTPGSPVYRRGDPNSDGLINLTDAVVILRHLQGAGELPCIAAADADGDTAVTATDVVVILQYLFQAEPAFPSPGPEECFPVEPALCKASNCRT